MGDFADKLRSKEAVEEDIYFAKQDVELIEALHKKKLAKLAKCVDDEKNQAKEFEQRFASITKKDKKKPRKLLRSYRALLDEIRKVCKRRH